MTSRKPQMSESERAYRKAGLRLDYDLLGGRPLLVPLVGTVSTDMMKILNKFTLRPAERGHAETAIAIAYVVNKGWTPFHELAFLSRQFEEGKGPCPAVSLFQVSCNKADSPRVSTFIASPDEFELLRKRYERQVPERSAS